MTEKGRKFYESLSKDEKLRSELAEIMKGADKGAYTDTVTAFAKANGFDIDKTDISADKEELAPEELEQVTGGGGCGCAGIGYGEGDDIDCVCSVYGEGTVDDEAGMTSQGGCICIAAGAGATNRH